MAVTAGAQSRAVVDFVQQGEYPDDATNTLSSDLQTSALASAREQLATAKEDTENAIKDISRKVAPDVDGWIRRAKELQADIEKSRNVAREIVQSAEKTRKAQETRTDAANQSQLLRTETRFHSKLYETLQGIQGLRNILSEAKEATANGHTSMAFDLIKKLEDASQSASAVSGTSALDLVRQRTTDLRKALLDQIRLLMGRMINVNTNEHTILVKHSVATSSGHEISSTVVVKLAASLQLLASEVNTIKLNLEAGIISPIFTKGVLSGKTTCVQIDEDADPSLRIRQDKPSNLLQDLTRVASFINKHVSPPANRLLADAVGPSIAAHLHSRSLPAAIPTSLEDVPNLKEILEQVTTFADALDSLQWCGGSDLRHWAENISKHWSAKKREQSIDAVRRLLSERLKERKQAEHVETQVLSTQDAIVQNNQTDDWDEEWGDEAEEGHQAAHKFNRQQEEETGGDEDWGAWDADEAKTPHANGSAVTSKPQHDELAQGEQEEEEGDDWGWSDQQQNEHSSPKNPSASLSETNAKPSTNGQSRAAATKTSQQEITLRESYIVTGLPDSLHDYLSALINNAQQLQQEPYASSPISPAAPALTSIPAISLAAFRSLAPSYYELLPTGGMLLYNDSARLASLFRTLSGSLESTNDPLTPRFNLVILAEALGKFAGRCYSKSMDEQRTIVTDFIDNAQGFMSCTTSPYKEECDNAISMTVAHIRSTAVQWQEILSPSALYQSLGSLLSTVINKMIRDIEDLSDIGSNESSQLRHYCEHISSLADLFKQDDGKEMVGLYVRPWFKFQYLAEVLESNLNDIKFSWKEGGLDAEFDVDELVELMKALFAEGDRRREAVREIEMVARGRERDVGYDI